MWRIRGHQGCGLDPEEKGRERKEPSPRTKWVTIKTIILQRWKEP
jgi:hypothetical protein